MNLRNGLIGILACLTVSLPVAAETEALLNAMREGGVVLLIRHSDTESGIGDPPGFSLRDCATQRNLSASGREQSRRIGDKLRAAGVKVSEVRSSEWCRCLDTAKLAFGGEHEVKPWPVLNSLFADSAGRAEQVRAALAEAALLPAGANLAWVTHQFNINAFTGAHTSMGEVVVARPREGGLEVLGKWRP